MSGGRAGGGARAGVDAEVSRLDELAERLDRLARRPFQVRSAWARVAGPLLRKLSWRPRIATRLTSALVDRIDPDNPAPVIVEDSGEVLLGKAIAELDDNVDRAERAVVVLGRLPDGHVSRLWRLYLVVRRAAEWRDGDQGARTVLAPMVVDGAARALEPMRAPPPGKRDAASRRAAGVDALIDAALVDTRSLGRQRRLLEAARRALVEAAAAAELGRGPVEGRYRLIARRIARLDRLEAAGVESEVALPYQARQAMERGEVERLHAVLTAVEEGAFSAGAWELRRLASAGLALMGPPAARSAAAARARSLATSQRELLGRGVCEAVTRAYADARVDEQIAHLREVQGKDQPDAVYEAVAQYLEMEYLPVGATLSAAVAADGCFDVGVAASPVRAVAEGRRLRVVRHPTQERVMAHATAVEDIPSAEIGDPRSVVMDLAAGRLLVKRYVSEEPARASRPVVRGEARVYVLDGSGSMLGPRARMRDALLVAELATLIRRLQDPDRRWAPVLHYRYFNEKIGPTRRVATVDQALEAVGDVVATARIGGTDIQGALEASFEQIREARAADAELASAQVVLVTDGEASIDEAALEHARAGVGDLPVGVSIIALGQENPALRRMAAAQRARGASVFYQFIDDLELVKIVGGATAGASIHPPAGGNKALAGAEVRAVVAEIERHARGLDAAASAQAAALPDALKEVGLSATTALDASARARLAVLDGDRATLEQTFLRLFPRPPVVGNAAGVAADVAADLAALTRAAHPALHDDVVTALSTVTEVLDAYGAGSLERMADAVDLIERLLAEAGVAPWEYTEMIEQPTPQVAAALRAVQGACAVGGGGGRGSGVQS